MGNWLVTETIKSISRRRFERIRFPASNIFEPEAGGMSILAPAIRPSNKEIQMNANDRTADAAAIRAIVENWASAVRSRNFNGILAHHSADVLMFDVPPPLQSKGIEAYRKTWDLFFSWSKDPVVFDFTEMNITAGNDVGFVTALMRCAGTEKNG